MALYVAINEWEKWIAVYVKCMICLSFYVNFLAELGSAYVSDWSQLWEKKRLTIKWTHQQWIYRESEYLHFFSPKFHIKVLHWRRSGWCRKPERKKRIVHRFYSTTSWHSKEIRFFYIRPFDMDSCFDLGIHNAIHLSMPKKWNKLFKNDICIKCIIIRKEPLSYCHLLNIANKGIKFIRFFMLLFFFSSSFLLFFFYLCFFSVDVSGSANTTEGVKVTRQNRPLSVVPLKPFITPVGAQPFIYSIRGKHSLTPFFPHKFSLHSNNEWKKKKNRRSGKY